MIVLLWAALTAIREARAEAPSEMAIAGRAVAEVVNRFPKAEPFAPVWSVEDCKRRGLTHIANQADGGKWRVHCIEPDKRIRV